jgi:hypothetical protein
VILHGGEVGLIVGTHGRPFDLSPKTADRVRRIQKRSKIQNVIEGVEAMAWQQRECDLVNVP